jgi:hypothetical protein
MFLAPPTQVEAVNGVSTNDMSLLSALFMEGKRERKELNFKTEELSPGRIGANKGVSPQRDGNGSMSGAARQDGAGALYLARLRHRAIVQSRRSEPDRYSATIAECSALQLRQKIRQIKELFLRLNFSLLVELE